MLSPPAAAVVDSTVGGSCDAMESVGALENHESALRVGKRVMLSPQRRELC